MKILLLVTGSVACILTPKLIKELQKLGEVKVAVTESASKFLVQNSEVFTELKPFLNRIGANDIKGIVYSDADESSWRKRGDPIWHIELTKWADVMLVAPLTANTLAMFAAGLSNNLVTNCFRAWDFNAGKPCFAALSCNPKMLESKLTKKHVDILEDLGVNFIEPQVKKMMCGDTGNGAMANIDVIVSKIKEVCL